MVSSSNVSTGDTVLATQYNNLRTDATTRVDTRTTMGGVVVERTSSFTSNNSAQPVITLESNSFDGSGGGGSMDRNTSEGATFWDSGNATRIVAPVAGLYLHGINIPRLDTDTNIARVRLWAKHSTNNLILVHSVTQLGDKETGSNNVVEDTGMNVQFPLVMAASSYVEWYIMQESENSASQTFGGAHGASADVASQAITAWSVRLSY